MKNRRYRLANIVAIGAALTVAVASVWYRERVGRNPVASLGGLIGLILYLLFQVGYDTQAEMAVAAIHARIDLLEARLARRDAGREEAPR